MFMYSRVLLVISPVVSVNTLSGQWLIQFRSYDYKGRDNIKELYYSCRFYVRLRLKIGILILMNHRPPEKNPKRYKLVTGVAWWQADAGRFILLDFVFMFHVPNSVEYSHSIYHFFKSLLWLGWVSGPRPACNSPAITAACGCSCRLSISFNGTVIG